MMRTKFVIAAFIALAGRAAASRPSTPAGGTDVFEELFSASLSEDEVAFVWLGFSAVIVRTARSAVIIDPADLLIAEDKSRLSGRKIGATLQPHARREH